MPPNLSPAASNVRVANLSDRPALEALETASFAQDRIASRSWRRLLQRPSALVLVAPHGAEIAGALVLLFRRGSQVARIYSIAVAASARGAGIGPSLIDWALLVATARRCRAVRLETRLDNSRAQALFARQGFAVTGRTDGYYQDGMAALRLERPIQSPHAC